ncbi:MAG: hypothetical protein ACI4OY_10225 [Aristaeellaceae bacterium]
MIGPLIRRIEGDVLQNFNACRYFFEAGPGYYTRRDGKNELLLIHTHSGEGSLTWKGHRFPLRQLP